MAKKLRASLETKVELESDKAVEAVGWCCDAIYKDDGGEDAPLDKATHIEVTTYNDTGFHHVERVEFSENKSPSELIGEFLYPAIEETRKRRKARKNARVQARIEERQADRTAARIAARKAP